MGFNWPVICLRNYGEFNSQHIALSLSCCLLIRATQIARGFCPDCDHGLHFGPCTLQPWLSKETGQKYLQNLDRNSLRVAGEEREKEIRIEMGKGIRPGGEEEKEMGNRNRF